MALHALTDSVPQAKTGVSTIQQDKKPLSTSIQKSQFANNTKMTIQKLETHVYNHSFDTKVNILCNYIFESDHWFRSQKWAPTFWHFLAHFGHSVQCGPSSPSGGLAQKRRQQQLLCYYLSSQKSLLLVLLSLRLLLGLGQPNITVIQVDKFSQRDAKLRKNCKF